MKKLIITLCFLLNIFSFAQKSTTDWEKLNLKGKVKSLREIGYSITDKFSSIEKDSILEENNTLYAFNKEGMISENIIYNTQNSIINKYVYTYNNDNIYKEVNLYDKNNKLEGKIIPKYNNKNQEIETNIYDADEILQKRIVHNFNDNGKITETIEYLSDGSKITKSEFKYNNSGENIEIKFHDYENNQITIEHFDYDSLNKLVVSVSEHYDLNNQFKYKTVSHYNEFEKVNLILIFNENNTIEEQIKISFSYDEHLNWIKCTTYNGLIATYMYEREIIYYE